MDFVSAVHRGLTGDAPEDGSVAGAVAYITSGRSLRAARQLATDAGISERTWRRLRATPHGSYSLLTLRRLGAALRAAALPPKRRAVLSHAHVVVDGTMAVSSDVRDRGPMLVSGWRGWSGSVMPTVLARFDAGDVAGAAQAILEAMERSVDGSLIMVDTQSVAFYATRAEAQATMYDRH